jgi:hypothetical protein
MKCNVTFTEVTKKTIEIEGVDIFDVMGLAQSYAENPSEKIDFEKNPDDYEVVVTKIKEV